MQKEYISNGNFKKKFLCTVNLRNIIYAYIIIKINGEIQ